MNKVTLLMSRMADYVYKKKFARFVLTVMVVIIFMFILWICASKIGYEPFDNVTILVGFAELIFAALTWIVAGRIWRQINITYGDDLRDQVGYVPIAMILSTKETTDDDKQTMDTEWFFKKVWDYINGKSKEDDSYYEMLERELSGGYPETDEVIEVGNKNYKVEYLRNDDKSGASTALGTTRREDSLPDLSKPEEGIEVCAYTEENSRKGRFVEIRLDRDFLSGNKSYDSSKKSSNTNSKEGKSKTCIDSVNNIASDYNKGANREINFQKFIQAFQKTIEEFEDYFDDRDVSEIHLFVGPGVPNSVPAILQNRYSNRYGMILYDCYEDEDNNSGFLAVGKLEKSRVVKYFSRRSGYDENPGDRIRF